MHPLDGPLLKLERAKEHIDQFEREIGVWKERSNPYRATLHDDPKQGGKFFRLHVKDAPPHMSVVFGDAIGNLRASLDHLAWQLALLSETTPSDETSFPIVSRPEDFRGAACRRLQSVPLDAWGTFEALQPYHADDWRELTYLSVLNDLCNRDKHRTLSIVGGRGHITSSTGSSVWLSGALEDRQEIHMSFAPAKQSYYVSLSAVVGVLIGPEVVGAEGLRVLHDFVRHTVLPCFAGFFDERMPLQPPPTNRRRGRRSRRSRRRRN